MGLSLYLLHSRQIVITLKRCTTPFVNLTHNHAFLGYHLNGMLSPLNHFIVLLLKRPYLLTIDRRISPSDTFYIPI